MVVAGIHGDETVPIAVASALRHVLEVEGPGRVVIAAATNPAAILAGSRYCGDGGVDLNRMFPPSALPERGAAAAHALSLLRLIEDQIPIGSRALLLDLHESLGAADSRHHSYWIYRPKAGSRFQSPLPQPLLGATGSVPEIDLDAAAFRGTLVEAFIDRTDLRNPASARAGLVVETLRAALTLPVAANRYLAVVLAAASAFGLRLRVRYAGWRWRVEGLTPGLGAVGAEAEAEAKAGGGAGAGAGPAPAAPIPAQDPDAGAVSDPARSEGPPAPTDAGAAPAGVARLRYSVQDAPDGFLKPATPGSAGIDLPIAETVSLPLGRIVTIRTGLRLEIPPGYQGQIVPRGSTLMRGLHVQTGTVDSDFRGELVVAVQRVRRSEVEFLGPESAPIAQLVIVPILPLGTIHFERVDDLRVALPATTRGEGKLASTTPAAREAFVHDAERSERDLAASASASAKVAARCTALDERDERVAAARARSEPPRTFNAEISAAISAALSSVSSSRGPETAAPETAAPETEREPPWCRALRQSRTGPSLRGIDPGGQAVAATATAAVATATAMAAVAADRRGGHAEGVPRFVAMIPVTWDGGSTVAGLGEDGRAYLYRHNRRVWVPYPTKLAAAD